MPETDYLTRLGQVVYMVSAVEWSVLGDLESLKAALPEGLNAGQLAGQTTGAISKRLRAAVPAISIAEVRAFILAAADILFEISERRNHVMHARPATVDGEQVLFRWRLPSDSFAVSFEWLDAQIAAIDRLGIELDSLRYPARDAVDTGHQSPRPDEVPRALD